MFVPKTCADPEVELNHHIQNGKKLEESKLFVLGEGGVGQNHFKKNV